MPKQKIVKAEQFDKDVPIEFFMIEDNIELFNLDYHYQCNFYQIYWFTKANNTLQQVDFKSYEITKDQIWVIYPGQMHNINPTGVEGYFLSINKDYFNRIITQEFKEQSFRLNPPLWFELSEDKKELFKAIMFLFKQEWDSQKRTLVLEKYLSIYITHIQDLKELSKENPLIDTRVHKLLELVEKHYASHSPTSFYADKIALSVKRMNELVVKSTESTLNQHIHNRLLLEAKRLIGYSELNIQQIAEELGYSEVNYFNRFFKKNSGLTPLEFRKQVKKVQ
ncbi:helix-turn-helix domain-containing protein [Myroides marinus]|uniref:AraC-type DNA-binding protein n=1 Tax=Myroides marinus TaxID=703342 RepID=A0A1H6X6P1_9FLAO|nr:helix-turn-helix domain-containing protein [Myroides marinus]KUF42557.1 AraC family transcriptional regulator [Myroides marinus]MDM1347238.1 helix-turn-helix domain-containing protein [Myroides marinus]MDM1350292.1 helix-turn-helix domain-containing protein [Myroides marinus]MDM1354097.1 helix-turn-helix domain-containing protein [Myroides marinus]MDM1357499.1 helix-turn-helix domain-containing protein [Myroides marinus]